MTKITLFIIQVFYVTILLYKISAQECLKNSNQFYCKLSTKTPYRFIANYNDTALNFPGCTEKKIWLMVRHGTRFPGKKVIKSMIHNLPLIQKKILKNFKTNNSELSYESIKNIGNWKLSFDDSYTTILANEGEKELIDLGERMQARFPTLFLENYDKDLYRFKYTATQRTESSAKNFVLGLFGQHYSKNISFPIPEYKDPILRFYKKCQRWRIKVDKNPETYKEKDLFIKGKIFQNLLSSISKRIGFELDYETLKLIYMICAYETSWNEIRKSPWCDILTLKDIKILEFIEDLEYFWVDGYGYQLNYNQACTALKDMFTFFDFSDKSLVTAYFTHSGSILKMLSILGIAKDNHPLTHDSFSLHKDSRNWRTSLIDAFASNIAFLLYDCEKQGPSILFLHQERIIHLPGCPTEMCPMSIMKSNFPDTEQECQFDAMCSMDS